MTRYTRHIGYHYQGPTTIEAIDGVQFTLTTTLRGNTWRAVVYQTARHQYFRNGQPAPLAEYAMGLNDAANRLFSMKQAEDWLATREVADAARPYHPRMMA